MVQSDVKYAKTLATDLRKKGFSYAEIKKSILVPKSTLSYWLKELELTKTQKEKLKERQLRALKCGIEKKFFQFRQNNEKIRISSAADIKKISNRELWLMGIMLCWKEKFNLDQSRGVSFTSSNPDLVKVFLKWLKDIGNIQDKELDFDLFIKEGRRDKIRQIIGYWAEITGFSIDTFRHIYFQKKYPRRRGVIKRKASSGEHSSELLRIRVKASSMLFKQISGWIKGIREQLI
ncbi:MAG: hypothetical protein AAB784_03555 [Patescibacteria group bacterium]